MSRSEDGKPVLPTPPCGDLIWRAVTSPASGSAEANTLWKTIEEVTGRKLPRGVETKFRDAVPPELEPEVMRLTGERLGKGPLDRGRSRPAFGETVEDMARCFFE